MTFTVSRGIEDALAPDPPARPEPKRPAPPECHARRDFQDDYSLPSILFCQKREGHDDPRAAIGGRDTDPIHRVRKQVDGVTVTFTWPSERTI